MVYHVARVAGPGAPGLRPRGTESGPARASPCGMVEDLKEIARHEIEERRRSQMYLIGFAAVLLVVVIGLVLAFSWISSTVH